MNSVNNTLYQVLSETMEAEDILLACLRINATVKAIGEKIKSKVWGLQFPHERASCIRSMWF